VDDPVDGEPTADPAAEPTVEWAEPTAESADFEADRGEPADPAAESADPPTESADPAAGTADPVAGSADPAAESADSTTEPGDPIAESADSGEAAPASGTDLASGRVDEPRDAEGSPVAPAESPEATTEAVEDSETTEAAAMIDAALAEPTDLAEPTEPAAPTDFGAAGEGGDGSAGSEGGEATDEATDEGTEGLAPLSDADFESALEALLLVVDAPVDEEALATALDTTPLRVAEHLRLLSDKYTDRDRGIDLRRAGGGWRFYTRDRYAPYVEKLLLDGQRAKLTRAALETLAVIAYRQPVTRARVAAVRGVNCDGVIRTLLARGLVEETGTDTETGGFLYRTTELFLERLGLSSLDDLPPIAPLLPEVDSIDEL
jgi:segregation and condensation protein B